MANFFSFPDFNRRSEEEELMDDHDLSGEELRQNLDELEVVNRYLGGTGVVLEALREVINKDRLYENPKLCIADIGSGGGDLLRETAEWAKGCSLGLELIGVDVNRFMIRYAKEKSQGYREISYIQEDIFSEGFQGRSFDISMCSLFCHHFKDDELVNLLKVLKKQSRHAFIINDLHRNPLAYWGIWVLTRLLGGSRLIKNDAPLSVLRAFKRKELEALLQKAGCREFKIRWRWAFRYQVIVWT